jgi:hypothetical protein
MAQPSRILTATIFLIVVSLARLLAAKPLVELEIVFEPSLSANATAQKWTSVLGDLGLASVRFRPLQNGDQVAIKSAGTGDSAVHHVTALMNNRGVLVTPGGQFAISDTEKLKKWLADVAAHGGAPVTKTPFDLPPAQFDQIKRSLSAPISFSTKGQRPEKVIEQIRSALPLPLAIDPAVAQSLAADDPVRDELQSLSVGTALAAIARPAGAVLLPQMSRNAPALTLTMPQKNGDAWPIGWPPDVKDESKIIPKLFDFTHVDIDGVPASHALDAIAAYLSVPLLFDANNMVRQRIDLKKPVKIPAGQSFYRHILDRVLFQLGLKAEVRLDDTGNPFLWITTQ